MNETIRVSGTLTAIAVVSALLLSGTYDYTKARIESSLDEQTNKALAGVFPDGGVSSFKKSSFGNTTVYKALNSDGNTVGYAFFVEGKGYGGVIKTLVGVDREKKITGIVILSQQETPGLGDRITEVKPGDSKPWFQKQFEGKTSDELKLKRNGGGIDAVTGATISSKAVLDSVRAGLENINLSEVD